MTPPKRVLVVVTRRIGDVLLSTPLIHSLKLAWPETKIDALVFSSTVDALSSNVDVNRIIAISERPGFTEHLGLFFKIFRRYNVALSLLPGDRPTLYAWAAGKWRAGLLESGSKSKWKTYLLHRWTRFDNFDTHTILAGLQLADLLSVPRTHRPNISWTTDDTDGVKALLNSQGVQENFAILHLYPKFNYKMWSTQGWIELGKWLVEQDLFLVLTGSNTPVEIDYLRNLQAYLPNNTFNAAGKLSLAQTACLISQSKIFVGLDTATTHIAAALGVPTIALFGPSNPVKWGPWPKNYAENISPWRRCGTQRRNNVILIQGTQVCAPCLLEGCDRNIASYSDCLLQLPSKSVISAARVLLNEHNEQ